MPFCHHSANGGAVDLAFHLSPEWGQSFVTLTFSNAISKLVPQGNGNF